MRRSRSILSPSLVFSRLSAARRVCGSQPSVLAMCSAVAPLVSIAISAVFLLSLAAAAGFVAFLPDGFLAGLAALALRVVIVFLVDIVWLLRESGPGRIARANATDR